MHWLDMKAKLILKERKRKRGYKRTHTKISRDSNSESSRYKENIYYGLLSRVKLTHLSHSIKHYNYELTDIPN